MATFDQQHVQKPQPSRNRKISGLRSALCCFYSMAIVCWSPELPQLCKLHCSDVQAGVCTTSLINVRPCFVLQHGFYSGIQSGIVKDCYVPVQARGQNVTRQAGHEGGTFRASCCSSPPSNQSRGGARSPHTLIVRMM